MKSPFIPLGCLDGSNLATLKMTCLVVPTTPSNSTLPGADTSGSTGSGGLVRNSLVTDECPTDLGFRKHETVIGHCVHGRAHQRALLHQPWLQRSQLHTHCDGHCSDRAIRVLVAHVLAEL